ncbi:unnamed protein product [Ilex paraguariensis]|uniref:eIF-4F 25 kDa subunit n=1 Tax=Ilex paraguariensis TaxID=185542 RepID=A0ABC8QV56_9AQUA
MVEQVEKLTTATPEDQIEEKELEEGEIIDDEDEAESSTKLTTKTLKHPLEHLWTFWFDSPLAKSRQSSWGNSLKSIYTFSTVEEFWSLYNNIHNPSKLAVGADFYCFKNNIQPKWEDPICANGGKWTVTFARGKADICWLHTLLAMIGEQFDHGDEICGAVVNVRGKQDKVAIWTKNAANETAQVSIGRQWKEFLDCNDNIGFIVHDDAMKHDRAAKNRYNV